MYIEAAFIYLFIITMMRSDRNASYKPLRLVLAQSQSINNIYAIVVNNDSLNTGDFFL